MFTAFSAGGLFFFYKTYHIKGKKTICNYLGVSLTNHKAERKMFGNESYPAKATRKQEIAVLPPPKRLFCNILNQLIIFLDFCPIINYGIS